MIDTASPVERLTYSVQELCQALGVSKFIVQAWTNREVRPIPHIRTDRKGRVIYPREAVRQWLLEESAPVVAEPFSGDRLVIAAASTAKRAGTRNGKTK